MTQYSQSPFLLQKWRLSEYQFPLVFRSPRSLAFGNPQWFKKIKGGLLPWEQEQREYGDPPRFYQVILGAIVPHDFDQPSMPLARFQAITDDGERIVLASMLVDHEGVWGDDGHLSATHALGAIAAANADVSVDPESIDRHCSDAVNALRPILDTYRQTPLTSKAIAACHVALAECSGIPVESINAPDFCIAISQKLHLTPQEVLTRTNSPNLAEIEAAIEDLEDGRETGPVGAYLSGLAPGNQSISRTVLRPFPNVPASWPVGGEGAASETIDIATLPDGLYHADPEQADVSVFLKDLVANAVISRAKALSALETPGDAFTRRFAGAEANAKPIFELAPSLAGRELLVRINDRPQASKIVEALCARGEGPGPYRYHSALSDALGAPQPKGGTRSRPPGAVTWGLAAAVFSWGSSHSSFAHHFWRSHHSSLKLQLMRAGRHDETGPGSSPEPRAWPSWSDARQSFLSVADERRSATDLFVSALELHRAFQFETRRSMIENLRALFEDVLAGGASLYDPEATRHLWRTLFLVVPALILQGSRMPGALNHMPTGTIGAVVMPLASGQQAIDELGMIRRSRRIIFCETAV